MCGDQLAVISLDPISDRLRGETQLSGQDLRDFRFSFFARVFSEISKDDCVFLDCEPVSFGFNGFVLFAGHLRVILR